MKYRKKPVVVEAFQYDGNFIDDIGRPYVPAWAMRAWRFRIFYFAPDGLYIETNTDNLFVAVGDWIILDEKDGIFPCKPDVFEKTYEAVEDDEDN